MKQALNRTAMVLAVIIAFTAGLLIYFFNLAISGSSWAIHPANKHIYNNGLIEKAGDITDCNGKILATTNNGKREFNSFSAIRKATIHAVGDLKGYISTGIHSAYLSELCGYDLLNGTYNTSGKGNNIQLTINSDVSVSALSALGNNAGTVGIYNYKTGEIICMVSTPTFDPEKDLNPTGKGVYVNRLLSGVYAPGSIFKLVTTLSALENIANPQDLKFNCTGGVTIGGERLTCLGFHRELGMDDALKHSCNAFFAQTALKLGRNTLTATAEKVGFNQSLSVDGIECAKSRFEVKSANDIDFGWSGIGQYTDLVNPFQFMCFMGGIANEGKSVSPYLIKKITNPYGVKIGGGNKVSQRIMSKNNSKTMSEMMRNNVIKNYGDSRFKGLEVCGKTGTAEVGDKSTPHSWFAGFCKAEDKPYAFVVIVENAGAGNGAATRIAAKVLKSI